MMFLVCGYRYSYEHNNMANVKVFVCYKTNEEAWNRLKFLSGTENPIPTGFSQSWKNNFGVLWIHQMGYGDYEMNLNQPLSLATFKQS